MPALADGLRLNHFLARLDPDDLAVLRRRGRIVPMKFRKTILQQDDPVDNVYFPLTCMFSLLVSTNDKPRLELATIGREGMVGAAEAVQTLGAMGLALIQIGGNALRIDGSAFRQFVNDRPDVQRLMYQHQYALMRQVLYWAVPVKQARNRQSLLIIKVLPSITCKLTGPDQTKSFLLPFLGALRTVFACSCLLRVTQVFYYQ